MVYEKGSFDIKKKSQMGLYKSIVLYGGPKKRKRLERSRK